MRSPTTMDATMACVTIDILWTGLDLASFDFTSFVKKASMKFLLDSQFAIILNISASTTLANLQS